MAEVDPQDTWYGRWMFSGTHNPATVDGIPILLPE